MIRKSRTPRKATLLIGLGAAGLLCLAPIARAEKNHEGRGESHESAAEDEFPLAQAPAAVQQTMRRVAGAAVPDELDRESEHGLVVYQGEYLVGGVEYSMKVAESGELLEVRKDVAAAQLPAAVRTAVDKAFAGASIKKAREVFLKGATTVSQYELKLSGGAKKRIKVRPSGEIVG
ncbi:MAG TPA: hypothetical protein VFH73_20210 [Polyangia bacterium]|jgi:hypothetical protein|nr:hypothetical protein [Polyangia bacterium]